jgi:hypothetical protein
MAQAEKTMLVTTPSVMRMAVNLRYRRDFVSTWIHHPKVQPKLMPRILICSISRINFLLYYTPYLEIVQGQDILPSIKTSIKNTHTFQGSVSRGCYSVGIEAFILLFHRPLVCFD